MKKKLFVLFLGLSIMNLLGCKTMHKLTHLPAQVDNTAFKPLPPYSGPKAHITVADFEVKTAKATNEIGLGLRQMLVVALMNTNRFSLIERQELKESSSGPQTDKIKAAELIITAAVTEFEPQASGGSAGIGGGGGVNSGILGGLLGRSSNLAHMALDIRIVSASTSEVLFSTQVQGQATEMEKAIRICIIEAVRYIVKTVPVGYYKY